jgi:hypothetical protein
MSCNVREVCYQPVILCHRSRSYLSMQLSRGGNVFKLYVKHPRSARPQEIFVMLCNELTFLQDFPLLCINVCSENMIGKSAILCKNGLLSFFCTVSISHHWCFERRYCSSLVNWRISSTY